MTLFPARRQGGLALPIMLIILVVMMASSIYLLKASNSTTLTTSNLAYEAALTKAVDLGVHAGFQWLSTTAQLNKAALDADNPANGYLATYNTTQTANSLGFWAGSVIINDTAGNRIEYVIHRMCAFAGSYTATAPQVNSCMQTTANRNQLGGTAGLGDSLKSGGQELISLPSIHYIVTARIFGARGGNVVTQAVIMIGA